MDEKPRLGVIRLMGLVLLTIGAALAIGGYPTWRWAGWPGLQAALVAAGIIWTVLLPGGIVAALALRRSGPLLASQVFMGIGVLRMFVSLGMALLVLRLTDFPASALLVWVAGLYLPVVAVECVWVSYKLKKSHDGCDKHTGFRESS